MAPVSALCIAVIAGDAVTVLPTAAVTLRWIHTVEGSGWQEDYVAEGRRLRLVEARITRIGAGMEPPAGARRDGEVWRYSPDLPLLTRVDLANSADAGGYDICWDTECRALNAIAPAGQRLSLTVEGCAAAEAERARNEDRMGLR